MRIVHLYSGNLYGGIERALVAFAAAEHAGSLKAAEYAEYADQPAQLFALAFDGRLQRELKAAGAEVALLGEVRGRAPWTIWRARRRLVECLKPRTTRTTQSGHPGASGGSAYSAAAIAHSLWALAVLGPAAREAGALVALYLHNPPTAALWPDGWARRTPVDLVVANSRYTAAASRAFLPDSVAIECLHPPLPGAGQASGASPADRQAIRARVRRELETSDRDVVIVQASRMEAWKGHAALIGALTTMRELPGWTAWIVGGAQRAREQAYVNGLRTTVHDAGLASRVRFAGDREDVGAILAAADIYCQPNRDPEPFGLAFVEALGAGLPVVTTAAGGAIEVVTDDCGRLVPAGDAAALTAALRALVGDAALRRSLGAQGPARARALCHPRTQLARLTAILSRAAAMRPRTARMHAETGA
jgi:glycosyltransferase involved in cell wall biosynthesis